MNIGFVFDTVLLKKENDYYGLTLNYAFFKNRYLDKMENLTVITRSSLMESYKGNIDGYQITNGDRVMVHPVHHYHQIPDAIFKRGIIKNELASLLQKCDKVIIRMPSVLGILACSICEKLSIPYMIEMVACAWDGYLNHTNRFGKILAPFLFYFTRKSVKKCPYVVYVTNAFLQRRYPTSGLQFACSDVVLLDSSSDVLQKKIQKMESFQEKDFTMCTVANVGMKYKGHIYALQAMKKLKSQGIHISYYLAGNGDQTYLKKYIDRYGLNNDVHFLGSLTHQQVFELLDQIDVYIQPSLQEGLPRALVEAMSRGCFCIGSDAGGIPELIDSKYIFHKKCNKQLSSILGNLNREEIIMACKRNFQVAQKYEKNYLDSLRNKIYNDFIQSK